MFLWYSIYDSSKIIFVTTQRLDIYHQVYMLKELQSPKVTTVQVMLTDFIFFKMVFNTRKKIYNHTKTWNMLFSLHQDMKGMPMQTFLEKLVLLSFTCIFTIETM